MDTARQIAQFIRWRDWGPGKLTLLWTLCLYIAVAYQISFGDFIVTFLVFMVFATAQSALGFVINDWGDRDLDRRQFKRNAFNGKTRLESVLALALVVVMALVAGLPLILRPGFAILWLTWSFATVAYSLEPLRLKTKGLVGIAVSFIAQWFLPVLLAFAAFDVAGGADMWLLAFALTISGATLEIGHQRLDRDRDLATRAQTFAANLSAHQIDRLYTVALILDKIAIGLVLAVVLSALDVVQAWWSTGMALFLGLSYAVLLLVSLRSTFAAMRRGSVDDPYYGHTASTHSIVSKTVASPSQPEDAEVSPAASRSSSQLLHETLLNFAVPVLLGVAVTLQSPLYAIIFGLLIIWRVILGGADWRWPLRAIALRLPRGRQ